MQPHMKRAMMLLVIAIIGFISVRALVVPDSFGQYGWYRGDSVADNRNNQIGHAESVSCSEENCHKTIYKIWVDSGHKTVNCETCHGPFHDHVSNIRITPQPADDSREFCGKCHFKRVARPSSFPQIEPEIHGENLKCAYCHNPHKPWFI